MKLRTGAVIVAALLVPCAGTAQGLSASGRVGTLGIGADVSAGITPKLALRAGASFQPWEPTREIDGIDFSLDLPSPNLMGAVDFYVAGGFRLSAGLVSFGSDIEVTGELVDDVEIGNETYSPAEIGTLSGTFDTRSVAPWLGIGVGKSGGTGVGFTFDLGVAFSGEPEVSLSATGPIAGSPAFQADLEREEQNIQDEARLVKLYPVLSLGIVIGF